MSPDGDSGAGVMHVRGDHLLLLPFAIVVDD
jgi:hypothetical protein